MDNPMLPFVLLLIGGVIGIVALFAIVRIFTIEQHLRTVSRDTSRLVHIAEHQAGIKPHQEFA